MKEKTIVSTVVLAASLISYFYAKESKKDPVPHVMIGSFIGAVLGEVINSAINKNNKKQS